MAKGLVKLRRGLASAWASANTVLADGEIALDKTNNRLKAGNGSTAWNSMPYMTTLMIPTTGVPSNSIGVDGDFAIDSTNSVLYGPKAAGAWPGGVSFKGLTGTAGSNGSAGTPGAPGTAGAGVPVGGATNNGLFKIDGTDYNTSWRTPTQITALLDVATTALKGLLSSADKTKLDTLTINGLTGWIDVTKQAAPVSPANTASVNKTNLIAILSAAPAGSTIYSPGGTYNFDGGITWPSKQFIVQGQGVGLTGGNTIWCWTANVAGDLIQIPNTIWYSQFRDMNFATTVNQTAGACVNINGNAGTNFFNCTWTNSLGGNFFNVLYGGKIGTGIQDQSWNSAVVESCIISGYKSIGIFIDSAASSVVVDKCVIQGAWGGFAGAATALQGAAGIQTANCGALQIASSDVLGNINNILLSPGAGAVTASVFCGNTYFDNSGGSCIKIAGAGATVRTRFDTCSFTTAGTNYSTPSSGLSAFEIAGTYAFSATAGQGTNLINCNFLNTFGTTGTTNGLLVTNAADFSVAFSNFAAYTNGLNVTAAAALNVTKFLFGNNAVGTAGGYNGITTGVLINGGGAAFKSYNVHDNDFSGCTTCVTDNGLVSASGGQKFFSNNLGMWGGKTVSTAAASITTTATPVINLWMPKGGALVGSTYKATLIFSQAATGNPTVSLRFGVNGNATDATLVTTTPTIAAISGSKVELFFTVTGAIGATATTRCTAQNFVTGVVPTTANQLTAAIATPAVNTTVDNWLTLVGSISASTMVVLYAAIEQVS